MATPKKVTKKQPKARPSAARAKATKKPAASLPRARTAQPVRKTNVGTVSAYEMRIQAMVMLFTALSLVFALMAIFKYS